MAIHGHEDDVAATPTIQTDAKTDAKIVSPQEESIHASEQSQGVLYMHRGLDPELAAAIAQISPERRAELSKRVKLKLDTIMFPTLLLFYILNYLVSLF